LDEEKSKHAGLAHQKSFVPANIFAEARKMHSTKSKENILVVDWVSL
jgi:hypothetical protein